jgi:DNA-binding PadR family transcriptional regulator
VSVGSVAMSLLAILEERPGYGLQLKNRFEGRTGGVWPLNVGQVYTTLDRLQRDGLVAVRSGDEAGAHKLYEITEQGRALLGRWFEEPSAHSAPSREDLVLKLVMVARRSEADGRRLIQAERRRAVELLQDYTRLKRDTTADADLGWLFLLDSLIFQAEARVRWLDACEARLRSVRSRRPLPEGDQAEKAAAESYEATR